MAVVSRWAVPKSVLVGIVDSRQETVRKVPVIESTFTVVLSCTPFLPYAGVPDLLTPVVAHLAVDNAQRALHELATA
jgi:hypothetical protein